VSCLCPGPTTSRFRERAGTGRTRLARTVQLMNSATVAEMGYQAWQQNRRVIVTGSRNAFAASMMRFLPRRTVLSIIHRLQSPA
jgi:short-subunit dehydrogenase